MSSAAASTAGTGTPAAQRSPAAGPIGDGDAVVVIPERTSPPWVEQHTFVYHLPVGEFDVRDATWVEIACGAGITMPHRETRPRADVCPECLDAPARPFTVVGED